MEAPQQLFSWQSYHQPCSDPALDLDLGYFSSLSPTSSVDSFDFSPMSRPEGAPLDGWTFSSPQTPPRPRQASGARRSRSRYPGLKRQTASEREKLRMRDLTKALHHLRTHLPPSLAPPGQNLTKIQTLRLAIRYLAHLEAQLEVQNQGLPEEVQKHSLGLPEEVQNLQSHSLGLPEEVRNQSLGLPEEVWNLQNQSLGLPDEVQNLQGQNQFQVCSHQRPPQVPHQVWSSYTSGQYWFPQQSPPGPL